MSAISGPFGVLVFREVSIPASDNMRLYGLIQELETIMVYSQH
jgi:hypothetical protein